ncbi:MULTISPECIES: helix-turn-helix domain-containing protein [Providencia]|uniref:helix-turn-helix domain-containing protein n=1 Tax=Providencia TaxID=586 RepID=UPI00197D176A|nr:MULTISPECIES: helix-turn-helix transcriptional regulator [Providencia]HEC8329412.1 helix-turn-helix transcriptional regulator [Providencia rettgeri]MBN4863397.1 helix-turn-helix transcriptional regulator [Providencia stuartii]MBN4876344.1 helix-turn-helix transcriptional regulator [Providencia stuartii]MBN4878160.1 helix-turn-helix transcriptional regulator [Providencia stuartii]MBN4881920.1 helix-turn-helix transcriptional regulator [Providencia stuartii]
MLKNNKNLGLYIQKNRITNHISIEKMANLLDISTDFYLSYENGEKSIYADHLFYIAKILNIDISQLVNVYLE